MKREFNIVDFLLIMVCVTFVVYCFTNKIVCCYAPSIAMLGQGIHWLYPKNRKMEK